MKTFLFLSGVLSIAIVSSQADLSASRGGGGHGPSGGGTRSGGHVFLGHPHRGGAWFYGDLGYPYWGYYDYPGYYGYYSYPGYPPSGAISGGGQVYSPSGPSYNDLGKFWGKNMKTGADTREQFVDFLRSDMLNASDASRAFFRGGFLKSYKNGAPVLDRAMDEARKAGPAS